MTSLQAISDTVTLIKINNIPRHKWRGLRLGWLRNGSFVRVGIPAGVAGTGVEEVADLRSATQRWLKSPLLYCCWCVGEERAERQDFKVRHSLCPVHWQVLFTSTMSSRNILCNFGSYMTREDWNERFEPFIMSLLYFLLSDVNKPYSTTCKFAQAQLISSSHNKPDHRTL